MGQALYRKYRSKNLSEMIGQEHITDTLAQALKSGRISHAYLFTGPRGVGKTSIARILAHEINGLPYEHEDNHIDIIEIDAASNRGIDEIRDLREKVYMAPVSAKYKVYIIDEVHMLTTPAFNALLKTLEEPPAHAVFMLATTEAHKLPDTIVSRTQRYNFRPVEQAKVVGHLKTIAKAEKLQVEDAALALLAAHGEGSFRDSISLLDQAGSHDKTITLQTIEALLGMAPIERIETLLSDVWAGNLGQVAAQLHELGSAGYQPAMVASQLSAVAREQLLSNASAIPADRQLRLLAALLAVAPAHNPAATLEIALLRCAGETTSTATSLTAAPVVPSKATTTTKPQPTLAKQKPAAQTVTTEPEAATQPETVHAPETEDQPVIDAEATLDPSSWPDLLQSLKKRHNTLYGILRMAVPEFLPGKLQLRFQFAFHQKRMQDAKHRTIIGDTLKDLTGKTVAIECLHDPEAVLTGPVGATHPSSEAVAQDGTQPSLSAISNIFGGGELLES